MFESIGRPFDSVNRVVRASVPDRFGEVGCVIADDGELARGAVDIDARLDLHGLRQDAAHRALRSFIVGAQSRGARIVLVITGKGRTGEGEDAGVLRRAVPRWLEAPDLRPLVVGVSVAHRSHGGDGALYVQVRRK